MANTVGYFNVEIKQQKKQQANGIEIPPRANFLAAADHIRYLFESKKFTYAVMGALEMLCLGYRREMPDLHIAYDDKDFNKIKVKLEGDKRIQLPDGMNPLFPSKLLVSTGPAFKDAGCTSAATIEVYLIPPGSHETPSSGMLSKNIVLLSLKEPKLKTYKGLNLLYLVKTLVHYCRVRNLVWDPRKDILFLCQHYGEDIQSIRSQLNQREVQQNLLGTAFFSRLSLEDQRRCYQVLLGKEPPPIMAITPPAPQGGHKYSHSASEIPRPRLVSQNSSPALGLRPSPALLSPPLPGKPIPSRQYAARNEVQPAELATPYTLPSELPASARDSRSRYRPVSAPNSRNTSPRGPQSPSMSADNLTSSTSRVISNLVPTPVFSQGRKSMPNLNDRVVPIAFAQPFAANGVAPSQPPQYMFQMLPNEMSANPAPYNPGQQHLKSQLGLGGDYLLPNLRADNELPITKHPVLPNTRIAYEGPQKAKIEHSGTPKPQSQMGSLHVVSPKGEAAPLQQYVPNLEEVTSKLHLVGPEGLYTSPKSKQSTHTKTANVTQPSNDVFELDAAPQQQNVIVAELEADMNAIMQENRTADQSAELSSEHLQQTLSYTHCKQPTDNSPVHIPNSHIPTTPRSAQDEEHSRPPNPRTQSAPASALPASLMAGGLGGHRPHSRTPSTTLSSTSPQTSPSQLPVTKTNASRYSRYYSPPSSAPISNSTSPQLTPAPLSLYKAYHPPSSIPSSSAENSMQQQIDVQSERPTRKTSFESSKDAVDEAERYTRMHRRDGSHDSHVSDASRGSRELVEEYQAELPDFESGYGGGEDVGEVGRR
ncbi:Nn.00g113090.m01.CDS01 [Neocucurbitaria sp. VM-36]